MRTIPQIRLAFELLADELECGFVQPREAAKLIRKLSDETRRRPPVRRAPARRSRLTPELRARIVAHAAKYPKKAYHDIATDLRTTIGRVSEALAGFRESNK